jgi:hypothetical protein
MDDPENEVGGYKRFRHTLAFLAQRSAAFPSPASDEALMLTCGYADRHGQKFTHHRRAWDALRRPILLRYLRAIGATLDVLALTETADMEDYYAALALPLTARSMSEHIVLAFGREVVFSEDKPEAEAVQILLRHSARTQHECCVWFDGLKKVLAYPDGRLTEVFYPPSVWVSGQFLVPCEHSSHAGACGLG